MTNKYATDFTGKRVLVVGGTAGIGYAVAEACTELGGTVIVSSSRESSIDKALNTLKASYPSAAGRISGKVCDLASANVDDEVEVLYRFATEDGKHKIDHVAMTAGDRFRTISLQDTTPANIQQQGVVRFVGAVILAKYALTYMNLSLESSFTTTSGAAVHRPRKGAAVRVGFGAALEGTTLALSKDLSPIRVNCVSLGAIDTDQLRGGLTGSALQETFNRFKAASLTQSIGRPEEAAESFVFLMKNKFATGSLVEVNGGCLLA